MDEKISSERDRAMKQLRDIDSILIEYWIPARE